MILLFCGCGRRVSVFDQKMMLVSSYELTIDGTVHIQGKISYKEQGMPETYVSTTEILMEEAKGTSSRTSSFTYNKGSGEIRTDGLLRFSMRTEYLSQ